MLSVTHPHLRPALDRFFKDKDALVNARAYLAARNGDAKALCAELKFVPTLHGTMVCTPPHIGHRIHLSIVEGGVRPGAPVGTGDFYPKDASVPLLFEHLAQPLAYILEVNW